MVQQHNQQKKEEQHIEDITGVTCIYIPVKNVYKSIKWYQKNLGCEPTAHNAVKPKMERAILRFPDHAGNFPEPGQRQTVPALFLVTINNDAGIGSSMFGSEVQYPITCFITPRIELMYTRFKENGVNILSEIQKNRSFIFYDPDGNKLEMWQPESNLIENS